MKKIILDERYAMILLDERNLALEELKSIQGKKKDEDGNYVKELVLDQNGKPLTKKGKKVYRFVMEHKKYEWQRIGYYGKNFNHLINAMIIHNVMTSSVETLQQMVDVVDNHIRSINYDGIIKQLHKAVTDLERENKNLKREIGKENMSERTETKED